VFFTSKVEMNRIFKALKKKESWALNFIEINFKDTEIWALSFIKITLLLSLIIECGKFIKIVIG
jgi:hypothetical protein